MSVPQAANRFGGVIVPMGSPFTTDGRTDREGVHRVVKHLVIGGVQGVFIMGTMGEGLSIPREERVALVAATAEALKSLGSNAAFYVNISGICLRDSIEESKRFMDAAMGRISTFVAHPPFYYPIGPAEIRRYYDILVEAVPGQLMLYNIPQTTKVAIPIDVVQAFVDHPKIIGFKDSDGSAARIWEVLDAVGQRDDFSVTIGSGLLATEGIKRGAAGMVVSGANIRAGALGSMVADRHGCTGGQGELGARCRVAGGTGRGCRVVHVEGPAGAVHRSDEEPDGQEGSLHEHGASAARAGQFLIHF